MTDPQQEYANALHRIAELEAERDKLRKALQEAKYQINHSQDTDYIIYHIDKALEIE